MLKLPLRVIHYYRQYWFVHTPQNLPDAMESLKLKANS